MFGSIVIQSRRRGPDSEVGRLILDRTVEFAELAPKITQKINKKAHLVNWAIYPYLKFLPKKRWDKNTPSLPTGPTTLFFFCNGR